jgi:hypothetical protein
MSRSMNAPCATWEFARQYSLPAATYEQIQHVTKHPVPIDCVWLGPLSNALQPRTNMLKLLPAHVADMNPIEDKANVQPKSLRLE